MKKLISAFALLISLAAVPLWAQAPAAAPAADTNAPPASTEPKPDPAGTMTGAAADAQDAMGNHFVVSEPTALSDDDKKDPAKVKKFEEDTKAYKEYLAQAKLEPLAVKLSDSVGHNRVA